MESFIFNNFKKRLVDGDVPASDTWTFYPVNKKFTEDYADTLRYIKNSSDLFALNPSATFNDYKSEFIKQDYLYKKMFDTDIKQEPIFVTQDSFKFFSENITGQTHLSALFFELTGKFWREDHKEDVMDNGVITQRSVPKGFYYIRTSEELAWCADKVNNTTFDNTINIVLGDNIGVYHEGLTIDSYNDVDKREQFFKRINYCIGSNPAQPYEGIFFGNGFKFINTKLECNNETNGIFGYLGTSGWLDTVDIDGINVVQCNKKLSITHLKTIGSNIYAGYLCGKNNGLVKNVYIHGDIYYVGFKPEIYNSLKKDDKADNVAVYNIYYPDYLCYNSPGNIIPYIGYFNEGVFATYSGYRPDDNLYHLYWNTQYDGMATDQESGEVNSPLEWYYWDGLWKENAGYLMHFTNLNQRYNILWYDGKIVDATNRAAGSKLGGATDTGLLPIVTDTRTKYGSLKNAPYLNKSIKMSQQNRIAYYVSPVAGVNNSEIDNIKIDCSIHTSGTFVGFLGGVAGMQNYGNINNVFASVSAFDETDAYGNYYRNVKSDINIGYCFCQKSIKNISSLFGSCVVQGSINFPGLTLNSVSSYFVNCNAIQFKNGNNRTPEYNDYYFANRFGSFAAIVEYNSSNISDIFYTREAVEAFNPLNKCINVKNSMFGYVENTSNLKNPTNSLLCTPYLVSFDGNTPGVSQLGVYGHEYNMYGVASPLFAEIKPVYLAVPSIISTVYENNGHKLVNNENYAHVGAFGVDQNFASPSSNPNFWSINTEVDLPGISNSQQNNMGADQYSYWNWQSKGYSGPVIDRLNNPTSYNFDIDIRSIASKLAYWENCSIINNYSQALLPFSTVKVPVAASIPPAYFARAIDSKGYAVGNLEVCTGPVTGPGYAIDPGTNSISGYGANKLPYTYAYFGSDIVLNDNTVAVEPVNTDRIKNYKKLKFTANCPIYTLQSESLSVFISTMMFTSNGHLANNIEKFFIEISEEAFNYMPFTNVPLGSTPEEIGAMVNKLYSFKANRTSRGNSNKSPGIIDGEYVDLRVKFGWNGKYNAYAYDGKHEVNYGFIFYTDYTTAGGDARYGWVVIPFDVTIPFDKNNTDGLPQPPYGPFECFYIVGWDKKDSDSNSNKQFDGIITYGSRSYGAYRRFYITSEYIISNETDVVPIKRYLRGVVDGEGSYDSRSKIWSDEDVKPALTEEFLVVAQYGYDPNDTANPYKFINKNDPTQLTLNFADAKTGYFRRTPDDEHQPYMTYLYFMDLNRGITATDGRRYQCYGPYKDESFILSDTSTYIADVDYIIAADIPDNNRLHRKAVPYNGFDRQDYNWQTVFEYYIPQFEGRVILNAASVENTTYEYNYEYKTLSFSNIFHSKIVSNNDASEWVYPNSWKTLNLKGTFHNFLYDSYDQGGTFATLPANTTGFDTSTFSSVLVGDYYSQEIIDNMEIANSTAAIKDNFYKYTYYKESGKLYKNYAFNLNVNYAYLNNKAGFWFRMPNCSGSYEFNDKVAYYPNVLSIGKTLNQKSILNKCLTTKDAQWKVSAFSADDFEGIYVTDNKSNPVMYIDVGLGECSDGTTWSLSSYPSIDYDTYSAEYKKSHPGLPQTEIDDATEQYIENNGYGLLLEVGNEIE